MKEYDPKKESKYTMDLDVNNMYGWAMGRYLPYGDFKRVKNTDNFGANLISENSLSWYTLEVHL